MASVHIQVDMKDNSEEVLRATQEQIAMALEAIGGQAQGYAVTNCPVDTGRLRNSITFATSRAQGDANGQGGQSADAKDYSTNGTPEENTVYIGTNVEYAAQQEYFGKHKHFLRDAITKHGDSYKKIVEAALKT